MRGQTLDLDLAVNKDDGFITSIGDDLCSADPAISCNSGLVVTDELIASGVTGVIGLCHTNPSKLPGSLFVFCNSDQNVGMVEINDKTHPLWQQICTFLGGDTTKCKPHLRVTFWPAGTSPLPGLVTSVGDLTINCGSTCEAAYEVNTQVILTVTDVLSAYQFDGWSGCDSTTDNGLNCVVDMNQDKVVTPIFSCLVLYGCGQATTYSYQGNPYTNVGISSPDLCPINGSFTTAAPLPPNYNELTYPISFSFTDCLNIITNENNTIFFGASKIPVFQAITDEQANIVSWSFYIGDAVDVLITTPTTSFTASTGYFMSCKVGGNILGCAPGSTAQDITQYQEAPYGAGGSDSNLNVPGSWTSSPAARPGSRLQTEPKNITFKDH